MFIAATFGLPEILILLVIGAILVFAAIGLLWAVDRTIKKRVQHHVREAERAGPSKDGRDR